MSTIEQMADFVNLWDLVHEVELSDTVDSITWRWKNDGEYSAKSAYEIQFAGSYRQFNGTSTWKAQAEGKHKFFCLAPSAK
ncbi:hypothetical protein GQ55_7G345400 [Panicum hallii var. hallii]|uniref:Uncharacterized protein n=1 Tax=Panicum hallii var. hallii TaxID=1504633 RepID=A0A2T7D2B2_9POAL|nr:hypothetical protein GQ55_7G345400 [Panicum hallii var. hallii]